MSERGTNASGASSRYPPPPPFPACPLPPPSERGLQQFAKARQGRSRASSRQHIVGAASTAAASAMRSQHSPSRQRRHGTSSGPPQSSRPPDQPPRRCGRPRLSAAPLTNPIAYSSAQSHSPFSSLPPLPPVLSLRLSLSPPLFIFYRFGAALSGAAGIAAPPSRARPGSRHRPRARGSAGQQRDAAPDAPSPPSSPSADGHWLSRPHGCSVAVEAALTAALAAAVVTGC